MNPSERSGLDFPPGVEGKDREKLIIEQGLEDRVVAEAHKKLRELQDQETDDQPGGEKGIYNNIDYGDWSRRNLEGMLGKEKALELAVFLAEYSESLSLSRVHLGMANTDEEGHPHWANEWRGGTRKIKHVDIDGHESEITVNVDTLPEQNKYIVGYIREELELDDTECPDLTEALKPGQTLDRKNPTHRFIIASQMHANMGYRMGRGNTEKWVANLGAAEMVNQFSDSADIARNEGSVYGKPHEVGLFIWKRMPGAYLPSINRTRQFQGRAVKDVGVYYDKKYSVAEIEQQKKIAEKAKKEGRMPPPVWLPGMSKIDLEQFYKAWSLNSSASIAFLSRTGWTFTQANTFVDIAKAGWNDYQVRRLQERYPTLNITTIEDVKAKKLYKDIGGLSKLPEDIDKAGKPSDVEVEKKEKAV